jgi:hypothetical protein
MRRHGPRLISRAYQYAKQAWFMEFLMVRRRLMKKTLALILFPAVASAGTFTWNPLGLKTALKGSTAEARGIVHDLHATIEQDLKYGRMLKFDNGYSLQHVAPNGDNTVKLKNALVEKNSTVTYAEIEIPRLNPVTELKLSATEENLFGVEEVGNGYSFLRNFGVEKVGSADLVVQKESTKTIYDNALNKNIWSKNSAKRLDGRTLNVEVNYLEHDLKTNTINRFELAKEVKLPSDVNGSIIKFQISNEGRDLEVFVLQEDGKTEKLVYSLSRNKVFNELNASYHGPKNLTQKEINEIRDFLKMKPVVIEGRRPAQKRIHRGTR